jgi:hypothetical protein
MSNIFLAKRRQEQIFVSNVYKVQKLVEINI